MNTIDMNTVTTEQITEARDWIADSFGGTLDAVANGDYEHLTDKDVVSGVQRHYEGGWDAFVAECVPEGANAPETRFEVRPFAGLICGHTVSGFYVHDHQDDTARTQLYVTEVEAQEHRMTLVGAQRAIDATERAMSTPGYVPTYVTGWC